ncbi:YhdP family protein [Salinisphaera sp.]|uniref:YhdP family phospholipid transporter n=1 Tax=Salinisphaera sp. TaxID=1914330 RepID=UPI002D77DB6D|nr:AsmA-like C-terminal region-containing protein [Salinisphaera sp.]HET7313119.1 AsmA-like C-terminal region-containing protein [Salinisphaera sp.]
MINRTPRARPPRGWIKRSLIIAGAGVIVLAGLLVGGVFLFDRFAPQYRHALADRVGQRIHAQVTASGLEIGWGRHGPIVYLDDPRITRPGADRPALTADRLGLEFSLSALLGGSRLPDGLIINNLHASLVQRDGRLRLAHWGASGGQGMNWSKLEAVRRQIAHVRVDGGELTITAEALPGGRMRWSNLHLALDDHNDHRLQASASAQGPAWWPALEASVTLQGALAHPDRLHFSLHGDGIRPLAVVRRSRPGLASQLRGGRLSFDLDGHWRHDRLIDTRFTLDSGALARQGHDQPLVPAFTAVFKAHSDRGARRIDVQLARLTSGLKQSEAFDAKARFDTALHALSVTARHLPGPLALRIARLAEPRLADTAIDGSIDNLSLNWRPGRPLDASIGFSGLTIDNPHIAFGPIAGRYRQQGEHHTLVFNDAGGQLSSARYIDGDVDITDLGGRVSWQPDGDHGWSIDFDKLRLASRKARLTTSGHVHLPGDDKSPIVDISADIVAPHIARLLGHVPQTKGLPNPRLRDWLPKAIVAGSLDRGHVEIDGPINRFPFARAKNGNGFHMTLAGHGVEVRYKPGWPKVSDAKGTVSLDNDALTLDLAGAEMLGVGIDSAKVQVDDVREPVMHLTGSVDDAPATKLMAFIAESPLRDKFGKLVDALDVKGPADLGVNLRIPLKPGLGDIEVDGTIDAKGDTLRQRHLPGPITGIEGELAFTERGITAPELTGRMLGVPISADITKAPGGGQRITARAKPSLPDDRAALAYYLPDAWLVYAKGTTAMTVGFTVKGSGRISPIDIDSDLVGMAIRLPAPLTKPAATRAPLTVTVDPDSGHIDADYDQRLQLAVDLDANSRPERIHALVGATDLQPPDTDGLWIGGHANRVDGLGWFYVVRHVLYGAPAGIPGAPETAAIGPGASNDTDSTSDLAFLGGDLTIGRLYFGNRYIAGPHIRAQRMTDVTGWRVNFEGDDSQGQITWTVRPGQATRIAGNLKRIALHTETAEPDADSNTDADTSAANSTVLWPDLAPNDLPAMQLFVQNFVVDGISFGRTRVNARASANGWSLEHFRLAGGALTGTASAHWQRDGGVDQAAAHADFDGHGLARLLRSFGYVSPIRAKQARIKVDLAIAPNDNGLDLRYLNGHVHLALDHGTLLTVEPGPGRLLGLFNLYVLPRRLRLDFRDVVDKGMAFDKVRADFNIRQGQAFSDNARILTPSAKIRITGRIGIATRDYNEHVTITPQLGSGVAIASAVLGGPIVGAAVFAVQELLKKPIQHFSSVSYNLKGSWDDPQIVNPQANDGDHNTAPPSASEAPEPSSH